MIIINTELAWHASLGGYYKTLVNIKLAGEIFQPHKTSHDPAALSILLWGHETWQALLICAHLKVEPHR